MTNYYVVKMKDDEVLRYGLDNHLFAMQQQYGVQTTQTVTTLWNRISRIQKGDWLIACQAGVTAFAIGKVREPRLHATHTDSIQRAKQARNHNHSTGVVYYNDCSIFYENFDHPASWGGKYAQRIDVEKWLFVNKDGVWVPNIKASIVDGSAIETIYGINHGCFKAIENDLKGGYMNSPRQIQLQALRFNKQIILQGPPGTSKTWNAKKLVAQVLKIDEDEMEENRFSKKNSKGRWALVQFHPSYNYEDFVRGIQVTTLGTSGASAVSYDTLNRIFGEMAEAAQRAQEAGTEEPGEQTSDDSIESKEEHIQETKKNDVPPYVLIIDEINRANLAAVLGELIYALEYRGEEVDTPYEVGGSNSLKVPKNLYIIGTMNTADRSVGHIDYAVRRRFVFVSLLPEEEILVDFYRENPPADGAAKLSIDLFKAVKKLFEDDGSLAPDFYKDDVQVGHTYFMAKDCEELAMKFAYQVYPLLREYFKDGILVPKGGGKIEVGVGSTIIRIDKPEESNGIFTKILNLCCGEENPVPEQEDGQTPNNQAAEEDGMTDEESSDE